MTDLLSMDPGTEYVGLARFEEGRLVGATSIRGVSSEVRGAAAYQKIAKKVRRWISPVEQFVYERPRVREGSRGYSDDLFELMGVVGAVSMLGELPIRSEHFQAVMPRSWTGGRPKQANRARMWKRLGPNETEVFPERLVGVHEDDPIDTWEHAMDAVCVGLHELERWL